MNMTVVWGKRLKVGLRHSPLSSGRSIMQDEVVDKLGLTLSWTDQDRKRFDHEFQKQMDAYSVAENSPNKAALNRFHQEICDAAYALMGGKNADYAEEDRPLKNFELCEYLGVGDVQQGIFVRLCDKIARLAKVAGGGSFVLKDESAHDDVKDAINYLILWLFAVESGCESRDGGEAGPESAETPDLDPVPF